MKKIFLLLLLPILSAMAAEKNPALIDMQTGISRPAPVRLELESYLTWVKPLLQRGDGLDALSAFTPIVFGWYREENQRTSLPPEVYNNPNRIYVNVETPLRQTIDLETAGEIEEGNTVGADVYMETEGTADQALAALLFLWGKPVNQGEGFTHPLASPFAKRIEYFSALPELGANAYANLTLRRDGGIVKDIADRYIVLVRGDSSAGYDVVMQFVKPALKTLTKQVFAIGMLRPMANGKVSYRLSTRFQGQNYKVLGNVSIGRSQIGFNRTKVTAVAENYGKIIKELRETGTIKDHKTDIGWGR